MTLQEKIHEANERMVVKRLNGDYIKNEIAEKLKEHAAILKCNMEELKQYRAIGTVNECSVAMEKQKAKKPIPIDYKKYIGVIENAKYLRGMCWCPYCRQAIKSGTFCENCGQKLDWED